MSALLFTFVLLPLATRIFWHSASWQKSGCRCRDLASVAVSTITAVTIVSVAIVSAAILTASVGTLSLAQYRNLYTGLDTGCSSSVIVALPAASPLITTLDVS